MTTSLGDMRESFLGRQLYKMANDQAAKTVKDTGNPIMGIII